MKEDLEAIIELMQGLKEKMELGEGDLMERLGRKKPGVEVVKMEVGGPEGMPADEDESPVMGEDDDFEDEESPEEKLKNRLAAIRG